MYKFKQFIIIIINYYILQKNFLTCKKPKFNKSIKNTKYINTNQTMIAVPNLVKIHYEKKNYGKLKSQHTVPVTLVNCEKIKLLKCIVMSVGIKRLTSALRQVKEPITSYYAL